jgi:hypothetical protein
MILVIFKEIEKKADKLYDLWKKGNLGIWEVIDKNLPTKSQHYKNEVFKIIEKKWKRSFIDEANQDKFFNNWDY